MQLEMICSSTSTASANVLSRWRNVRREASTRCLSCAIFRAVLGEEVPHTSRVRLGRSRKQPSPQGHGGWNDARIRAIHFHPGVS